MLEYCKFTFIHSNINIKATQYNSINVKLSNSQLNKLKWAVKKTTEVILKLSFNMNDGSNDETNFLHKLSLT